MRPKRASDRLRAAISALLPLVALGLVVYLFLARGQQITAPIRRDAEALPLPESVVFERIVFKPSQIVATVRNAGPTEITIAEVHVNDMATKAYLSPSNKIPRLGTAVVTIPHDWVAGDPYEIRLVSAAGLFHSKAVDIAAMTPSPNLQTFGVFALLGVFVGVIPVFLGIAWLPFMRRLGERGIGFLLALALGLLVFLGADSVTEALEIGDQVAAPLNPTVLVVIVAIAAFLLITVASEALKRFERPGSGAMMLATMIAFGIGIHNLAEGLAFAAAYAAGQTALGGALVLGFMIHNVTEGIAIVAPLSRTGATLAHLAALGMLAGAPAIFGAWIGGFAYSPLATLVFLSVGAGAVFQVAYAVVRSQSGGLGAFLSRPATAAGLVAGFGLMYATSLLVV